VLDPERTNEAMEARDRLLDLQHEVDRARSDYHHAIRRMHAAGGSLREIADCLGLSHQRVHQIVEAPAGEQPCRTLSFPPVFRRGARGRGEGGRLFHRFTERARNVVVVAQEEAHALRHNYIGTEHLLLGLLHTEDGAAARVLASLAVTPDRVRAEVERIVGRGGEARAGRIPFTPRSKKVLELAVREAQAPGDDFIGTEHILLGLLAEGEGVAVEILELLGATPEAVRMKLEELLAA
jgi:DNA-binding CsgD family transcriptional regulator